MRKILLTIPEPCHENWDNMTPQEKGRFCGSCQKTVIDFSLMTDSQIGAFFRKPVGSVCGNLHADQLGRDITIPKKKLPWVRYFFQIAIPAFLMTLKVQAQKTTPVRQLIENGDRRIMGKMKASVDVSPVIIEGVVTDNGGVPVSNATVLLQASKKGTTTDSKGRFQLKPGASDSLVIVTAVGYHESSALISKTGIRIVLQENVTKMEEVVIIGNSYERVTIKCGYSTTSTISGALVVYDTASGKSLPILQKMKDTIVPSFSIYPNPATPNSVISIRSEKLEKGDYVSVIFDSKGAVIKISEISIQEKEQVQQLAIDNIAAGSYVLCLRNKKTGKQYTKKLIVH